MAVAAVTVAVAAVVVAVVAVVAVAAVESHQKWLYMTVAKLQSYFSAVGTVVITATAKAVMATVTAVVINDNSSSN